MVCGLFCLARGHVDDQGDPVVRIPGGYEDEIAGTERLSESDPEINERFT